VGQANFTSGSGTTTSSGLRFPVDAIIYQSKLIVADASNHRVLIWNAVPTTNGSVADIVIGQSNFTIGSANAGGSANASTVSSPAGLFVSNGKLFVSDTGNHRILVFNSIPTSNGASADLVIGQSDFTSVSANRGNVNPGLDSLNYPAQITVYSGKLIVADRANHRILIWNSVPTTNGASAHVVIGAPTGTTPVEAYRPFHKLS
jgi:hypothetical protein